MEIERRETKDTAFAVLALAAAFSILMIASPAHAGCWECPSSGADTLDAGSYNDCICVDIGNDSLGGKAGNDCIDGVSDTNTLRGDSGNDCLVGASGGDHFAGDPGMDVGTNGEVVNSYEFVCTQYSCRSSGQPVPYDCDPSCYVDVCCDECCVRGGWVAGWEKFGECWCV